MSRLVIVRGLPGSGKTTFARENFPGTLHIENDHFWMRDGRFSYCPARRLHAEKWAYNTIRKALEMGMDVVTSSVYGSASVVNRLAHLGRYYGARVSVYRMTGEYESTHDIPDHVKEEMRLNFEDYIGEEFVNPSDKDPGYDY